jgi:hypothetical protein
MLKHLFITRRRRPPQRHVRQPADPMPRIRWYS